MECVCSAESHRPPVVAQEHPPFFCIAPRVAIIHVLVASPSSHGMDQV